MKDYQDLLRYTSEIEIIDSHEHLPPEKDRVASKLDFSVLFNHYCMSDMLAAGMPPDDAKMIFGDVVFPWRATMSVEEKWPKFEPYYLLIQDGSYCRAAHLSMDKLYGVSRLNSLDDAKTLTAKMNKANVTGFYKKVLNDTCRIRAAVNCGYWTDDHDYLAPVQFATEYAEANNATISKLENTAGVSCGTLNGYVEAVRRQFLDYKRRGLKGIKLTLAYTRDLHFAPTAHADAERVFNRVLEEGYGWRSNALGYEEARPLQDYMVHRHVEMAGEMDLPVIFHTGHQAGSYHNPDDARPNRLWNLPQRYRNVDFVILHAGIPWMEEAALLAKTYPNVFLDMAWTHLISPELSTRALGNWIDMLPVNKIVGFGGDYLDVEKIYGHLVLARENIARALAARVEDGRMTPERAQSWIRAMLFDNPKRIYRLDV
ncbi:MAG: amidohydrolase family protein [Candidatus Marsarchaeota archaeon]|nr:amidohydrolase family protein [Candidatus Marsarchaeota archaeon]